MTAVPDLTPDPASQPAAAPGPARLRRPPRPVGGAATLTRLVAPGSAGAVPVAQVQGMLTLDLPPAAGTLTLLERPDEPGEQVRRWAQRFARAVVEVTGGDRPVTQLLRWTSPPVYADLERRARIVARVRPVTGPRQRLRAQIRSVHVFQPTATTAEVSVHVRYGPRSRALAARLELRDQRWTCTALQLG